MEHDGAQLAPLLETFFRVGGVGGLGESDHPFVRALRRASLRWQRLPEGPDG